MAGAKVGNARVGERGLVDEEVAGAQTVFGPSGPRKVEPLGGLVMVPLVQFP